MMFPSRINPSALPQSSRQQGESSRNQTRPSILSAQQIAQHLQQLSGQNNAFEASLGDSSLPVQHIISETMRQQELSKVLNSWIDQLPPSDQNQGETIARNLKNRRPETKQIQLAIRIGSTFPDFFPYFEKLENLILDTSHQMLPESLGTLKNLRTLKLTANGLQAFPKSLTQLSKLHSLSLYNFSTLPPFPQDAGKLKNLKKLDVFNYSKENALPANTHLLPSLLNVHLSSCRAIGNAFQQLQANKYLKELSIHLCTISTEQWYHIKALQALKTLNIASLRSLAFLPEDLFPMPSLTQLGLEFNHITQLPNSISQQQKLEKLRIERNSLLASIPENIGQLQSLQELRLYDCRSITHLPASIANLPSECEVSIEHTGLSVNVLQELSRQTERQRISSNGQSGPRVEFSVPPEVAGPIGTLQEEALQWMREVGNNDLPPQAQISIEQMEARDSTALATLLARLRKTAEYTQAPESTVKRIQKILNTLFTNPELLSSFGAMAIECTETCDDRTALGLLYMELALLEHQLTREIKSSSKASALNSIKHTGLGVFKQRRLMEIAHKHAKQAQGFVDETEIVLKFLTALSQPLELPASLNHMLHAQLAWQVQKKDIDSAATAVAEKAHLNHPEFLDFLATWPPMKEAQQTHFPDLWLQIEEQCETISTEAQKALEEPEKRYQTACTQYGVTSPEALNEQITINQISQTRTTKNTQVLREAALKTLNSTEDDDQAGPSKKPRLNRPD